MRLRLIFANVEKGKLTVCPSKGHINWSARGDMRDLVRRVAPALACVCVAGCASAIDGTTQSVYVTTSPISGAACTLSNERGSWSVISPGAVVIARSASVLKAKCSKDGLGDGTLYVASSMPTSALVGAMIPYVGIVSAAVDGSSGAGGRYPSTINVQLREAAASGPQPTQGIPLSTAAEK